MFYYQNREKQFICLPKNTKDSNDQIMISLDEIISIEPYDEDISIVTLSTGK